VGANLLLLLLLLLFCLEESEILLQEGNAYAI